jgi:hypothetical protein
MVGGASAAGGGVDEMSNGAVAEKRLQCFAVSIDLPDATPRGTSCFVDDWPLSPWRWPCSLCHGQTNA